MKTTKTNRAPIGSLWMGKLAMPGDDGHRSYVTVRVDSDPIPGNDLRMCTVTSQGEHYGKQIPVGANAFRARTGNLTWIGTAH